VLLQFTLDEYYQVPIHFKPGLIMEEGQVTEERTADFLSSYMNELHAFIVRVLTVLPRAT
jgi:chromate reductase